MLAVNPMLLSLHNYINSRHFKAPDFNSLKIAHYRNAYYYPLYSLDICLNIRLFPNQLVLDKYHRTLLQSKFSDDVFRGFMSVIYWANIDQRMNNYAFQRSRYLVEEIIDDNSPAIVLSTIKNTKAKLRSKKYDEALNLVCSLEHCDFSGGSLLLAVLAPKFCGGLDKELVKNINKTGELIHTVKGEISKTTCNFEFYQLYCEWLQESARSLNTGKYRWKENNKAYHWTALDVERAMYTLCRSEDQPPSSLPGKSMERLRVVSINNARLTLAAV